MRKIYIPTALILGAGNKTNINAINHDKTKHNKLIDIAWDLNIFPWPFKNEEFTFIEASSVFEHLNVNLLECMNECWRIMQNCGQIQVKLPYWNCEKSWEDPTHKRCYTVNTMNWFDPETEDGAKYSFYTLFKWKVLEKKLNEERSSIHFKLEKKGPK